MTTNLSILHFLPTKLSGSVCMPKGSTKIRSLKSTLSFLKGNHHVNHSGIYDLGPDYFKQLITNKEIRIYFQPIVDLKEKCFFAMEALARGPKNSTFSEKSPFTIIDEKNHEKLDLVCLENITTQIKTLHSFDEINGKNPLYFVNCLPQNIDFLRKLPMQDELRKRVVVELDINHRFFDVDLLLKRIRHLKNDLFQLALDDIGETNIDFDLIKLINPDYMKIDISLVKDISKNADIYYKTKKIVDQIRRMEKPIIAEGVENIDDLKVIAGLGCRYIQGFFFSKPVEMLPQTKEELTTIIKKAA